MHRLRKFSRHVALTLVLAWLAPVLAGFAPSPAVPGDVALLRDLGISLCLSGDTGEKQNAVQPHGGCCVLCGAPGLAGPPGIPGGALPAPSGEGQTLAIHGDFDRRAGRIHQPYSPRGPPLLS